MRYVQLPNPLDRQLEILADPSRYKVVCAGRRFGKTILGLIACVAGHGSADNYMRGGLSGGNVWWVAPSYPIASNVWRELKKALRFVWIDKSEMDKRIDLPGGGSVGVRSADNPDSLRGVGLDGVVLDEAAFMKDLVWREALRPTLAESQGWAIFISTPKGRNWFQEIYDAAEDREHWARWQIPTSENPMIPPAELLDARAELGPITYSQEFEAQFITDVGGVFKLAWFAYYRTDGEYVQVHDRRYLIDSLHKFITVDLATSTKQTADYTVIMTHGITPEGELLVLDVLRKRMEGPDILPAVDAKLNKWNASCVWIERAGFQLSLIQQARRAGLPVRELSADKDKVSRALPLTAGMEGGRVLFRSGAPWLKDLEDELLVFPPEGKDHDDQVDALAYAWSVASGKLRGRKPPNMARAYEPSPFDALRIGR